MIPVHQTRSGEQGNCFEACLASLLDCTIADVPPDFLTWAAIRRWLIRLGKSLAFCRGDGKPLREQLGPPPGYAIVALRLPDGAVHSVICMDGFLVHDPSPRPVASDANPVLLWTLIL